MSNPMDFLEAAEVAVAAFGPESRILQAVHVAALVRLPDGSIQHICRAWPDEATAQPSS